MGVMVYFKGPKDKRFTPMDIKTGELHNRLMYAPIYADRMIQDIKEWIDHNRQCAPGCSLQIREPGGRVLY